MSHSPNTEGPSPTRIQTIYNASLPHKPPGTTWDIHFNGSDSNTHSTIKTISSHNGNNTNNNSSDPGSLNAHGALVTPSLCNPHLHLDKPYLLSHPRYARLPKPSQGSFAEAMEHTTAAKALFTPQDLLERGRRVLEESVGAGVTHVRGFVEVDAGVGMKCLEAGVGLKRDFARKNDSGGRESAAPRCEVQLCAFAQLPLFSTSGEEGKDDHDPDGNKIRRLLESASSLADIDVLGSTPYVESDLRKTRQNISYMIELSAAEQKHLDFHLDYNLDPSMGSLVWFVIATLKSKQWLRRTQGEKTVVLGHCTRLSLFSAQEWERLREEIADLPISFVGLPTSDLFMMRNLPSNTRGTLNVVKMIEDVGLRCCLGTNNIGNAFTPQGSCDSLSLANLGVGVYSAGTERQAEILFECVSSRARAAIGLGRRGRRNEAGTAGNDREGGGNGGSSSYDDDEFSLQIREGDEADLVLFGADRLDWRTRTTVAEAVWLYDRGWGRRVMKGGHLINHEAMKE